MLQKNETKKLKDEISELKKNIKNKNNNIEKTSNDNYIVAVEVFSGTIVGLIIGYIIDGQIGTKPIFIIISSILGFISGFKNLFKIK